MQSGKLNPRHDRGSRRSLSDRIFHHEIGARRIDRLALRAQGVPNPTTLFTLRMVLSLSVTKAEKVSSRSTPRQQARPLRSVMQQPGRSPIVGRRKLRPLHWRPEVAPILGSGSPACAALSVICGDRECCQLTATTPDAPQVVAVKKPFTHNRLPRTPESWRRHETVLWRLTRSIRLESEPWTSQRHC